MTSSIMSIRPICRTGGATAIRSAVHHRGQHLQGAAGGRRGDAYEFHYYQKIPTLVGNDTNTNWLLAEYPNAYLFGLMVGGRRARPQCGNGATLQGAARRGVCRDHPALCADHRRHQPNGADRGVFLMADDLRWRRQQIADDPSVGKAASRARPTTRMIMVIYHTPQMLRGCARRAQRAASC